MKPMRLPGCATRAPHRLRLLSGLAAGVLLLAPAVSRAAPSYQVFYGHLQDTTTTSPRRVTHVSTDAYGSYHEQAYAIPGRVMARSLTTSTLGTDDARAFASTDDFIITGPAGPSTVSATIYFMLHVDLLHSGIATDNATSASGSFAFDENHAETFSLVMGDATSGNGSSYGHDALASYAGGAVDEPVSVTTALPVGVPFGINIGVEAATQASGDAITEARVAGEIGDASAHLMDLPPGYTVNSPSWGVVDNVSTGAVAAVSEPTRADLTLAPVAPNPSTGDATLSYALPRAGAMSLEILDLQGRLVRALVHRKEGAGPHRLTWDGRGAVGRSVSPGLYFVRLEFEGRIVTRLLTRLE